MNPIIKRLLLVCLLAQPFFVNAQTNFKRALEMYDVTMKSMADSILTANREARHFTGRVRKTKFVVIPYCLLNEDGILMGKNVFDLLQLLKDTGSAHFVMCSLTDSIVVSLGKSKGPILIGPTVSGDGWIADDLSFKLYMQAKKMSKYAFVLLLGGGNYPVYLYQIAGYIQGNSIKILARNGADVNLGDQFVKYNSIQQYIVEKFGSLEEYVKKVKKHKQYIQPDDESG